MARNTVPAVVENLPKPKAPAAHLLRQGLLRCGKEVAPDSWDEPDLLSTGRYNARILARMEAEQVLMQDSASKMDFISFSYYYSVYARRGKQKQRGSQNRADALRRL